MKLASLKSENRNGKLIVVNRAITHYVTVEDIANTLQEALENWNDISPELKERYGALNSDQTLGTPINTTILASPLPRAYQWLDGSAYLTHVERVRKARGAEMPPSFLSDPLMYQGGSDFFLGPNDPILAATEDWGIDFESEVAVITDDVPLGIDAKSAAPHIKLLMLVNDVSLRNLIPEELAKGFGFIHGKPPTAFSPVAITPDELGGAWLDSKVHHQLITTYNGTLFGDPDAGSAMQFSFADLIAHAAKTRPLTAGTIIGSGTVSNEDLQRGYSCLAEKRVVEIIETGTAQTPFMKFGDTIEIEMRDNNNKSLFGKIKQEVRPWKN